MTPSDLTDLKYARAVAIAIEAFRVLRSRATWFERLLISILYRTYQERLRTLLSTLPAEVAEEV